MARKQISPRRTPDAEGRLGAALRVFRVEQGDEKFEALCVALAKEVDWVHVFGHGSVTINAVGHLCTPTITAKTHH